MNPLEILEFFCLIHFLKFLEVTCKWNPIFILDQQINTLKELILFTSDLMDRQKVKKGCRWLSTSYFSYDCTRG